MTEKPGTTNDTGGEQPSKDHLDEALGFFRKGLASLGLFCTEQAIPTAETAVKEGLETIEVLLKDAKSTMKEAFEKVREEVSPKSKKGEEPKTDKDQEPGGE